MKIIWTICFIASTIYCLVWCEQNIPIYLQYQTYISTNLVQEIPTYFPAVSICNLKFSNKTKSLSYLNSLLFPNGIPIFSREVFGADDVQNYLFFFDYQQQAAISNYNNLANSSSQRNFGYEMSDMLYSCTFNWAFCSSNDFSYFYDPFYGNCFTFNSGIKANGTKVDYIKSAVPGPIFGLSLTLFLGNPTEQSIYQIYGNGIAVVIHNQTSFPVFGTRRILASAGKETDIAINRNFVSKIDAPYGNCLLDTSSSSAFASRSEYFNYIVNTQGLSYDQGYCYLICLQDIAIKNCNCTAGLLPNYGNASACFTIFDLQCIQEVAISFENAQVLDVCVRKCPIACNSIEYSTKASSSSYPNEYYKSLLMTTSKVIASNISFSDLDKSFLKVNIFYESMSYTQTTENPALTFMTFLSNIGGIFGLFIGISILSLIEVIELISLLFKGLFDYQFVNKVKPENAKKMFESSMNYRMNKPVIVSTKRMSIIH